MLIDWIHWVQLLRPLELLGILGVLLLVDGTRYALSSVIMVLFDLYLGFLRLLTGSSNIYHKYIFVFLSLN